MPRYVARQDSTRTVATTSASSGMAGRMITDDRREDPEAMIGARFAASHVPFARGLRFFFAALVFVRFALACSAR